MNSVTQRCITLALAATSLMVAGTSTATAQSIAQSGVETERNIEHLQGQQPQQQPFPLPPLTREVTYDDVLNDPSNVELNYLYALGRIKDGQLTKAQVALERILIMDPNNASVRAIYGVVLFRLGNFAEAKSIFNELLEMDLSSTDRALVDKYIDEINLLSKLTHYTASISIGIRFDNNKNAITDSGKASVFGALLNTNTPKRGDIGNIISASLEVRHDLGFQRPHEAYAKVSGILVDQNNEDGLDLYNGRIDGGGVMATDYGSIDLSLNLSMLHLGSAQYLRSMGAALRWDGPMVMELFHPYVANTVDILKYGDHDNTSSAPERDGIKTRMRLGAKMRVSQNQNLDINASLYQHNAEKKYNAFVGRDVTATYTISFNEGRFISGNGSYAVERYRKEDAFIDANILRKDTRLNVGLTAGGPIVSFLPDFLKHENLNGIVATTTIDRRKTSSNLANYSSTNWGGQFMISKQFKF
ncbi:MAG: tetratricopeptide repeat protein [Rhodospirillaceae bacterium]|nr:tetratricopeptide repeat protein [Rhodospirillaceae bacterium]